MKILKEMARGCEYEFSVNKYPPILPGIQLSDIIGRTILALKNLGFISKVMWSVEDEIGNLTYERGLFDSWLFTEGPYEIAFNGMRIYDDAQHLEFSTPVFRSPIDAVVYDKVAERLAFLGIEQIRKTHGEIYCYKTNNSLLKGSYGYEAVAWGTHGCYCVDRRIFNFENWKNIEKILIPFIISRIPLIGSGGVLPIRNEFSFEPPTSSRLCGDKLVYVISPRAIYIKQLSSIDTTVDRGFLNLRDEPHANPNKYWRLHDINLEAIRSDFQIFIRDALEVFILKATEEGLFKNPPIIKDPIDTIRKVSMNINEVDQFIELEGNNKARLLSDIFSYYISIIEKLIESKGDNEDYKVFKVIESLIQKLKEGRFEYLNGALDWIAKMMLIEEYSAKDIDMVIICNQYGLLDETTGFYEGRIEKGDSLFDPESSLIFIEETFPFINSIKEKIKYGMINPPIDTREYLRINILKEHESEIIKMNWWKIYFKGGLIALDEPLKYGKEESEEFLKIKDLKKLSEIIRGEIK
jgi:proteasome accessory factor A